MTVQLAAAESNMAIGTTASDAQVVEMQARIDRMSSALQTAEQRISTLQAEAEHRAIVAPTITDQSAASEIEIAGLRAEISMPTMSIEERDANNLALRSTIKSANPLTASICTEQTNATFADQKLIFDRGTATIAEVSLPLLEQLIKMAQQCADAGLIVEIGANTDSQGGELSSQTLSEQRARTVLDFLYSGGVPSVAMRAAGYGESQPIADSAISDGRSQKPPHCL